jgi:hypothetical protein
MDLEDVRYSREATIAAVTDYYTFLTQMVRSNPSRLYPFQAVSGVILLPR